MDARKVDIHGYDVTSLLKGQWMSFMTANGYLNTTVQKAFVNGISGCTEHHVKLLSIIEETHRKHKALAVCWLDVANAYSSMQHGLICYSLEQYHAPQQMVAAVSNLYQGLVGIVRIKEWSTEPFPHADWCLPGRPLVSYHL